MQKTVEFVISRKTKNGVVIASSHLVIIDNSPCENAHSKQLSNPNILNYYRQLLIKGYMANIFVFE